MTVATGEDIGPRLKKARATAEMTLHRAADATGISHTNIFAYENYGVIPTLTRAHALAKAYRVSLKWIATGRN